MKRKTFFTLMIAFGAMLLNGCASGPRYDETKYNDRITPQEAAANIEKLRDTLLLWGGVVVNTVNVEDGTRIEILGYPLDSSQKPNTSESQRGRFLVTRDEYLEPVDYAQGRLITVIGPLTETRNGKVGQADYTYPVIHAEQLYLWPRSSATTEPRIHFGIGVIFSN